MKIWSCPYFYAEKTLFKISIFKGAPNIKNRPFFNRRHAAGQLLVHTYCQTTSSFQAFEKIVIAKFPNSLMFYEHLSP